MKRLGFSILTAFMAGCSIALSGLGVSLNNISKADEVASTISFKVMDNETEKDYDVYKNEGVFELNDDITLSPNNTPYGTLESPFTGIFDGNGHTITIVGEMTAKAYQGIFGYAKNATLTDVKIVYENNATINASFSKEASEYYVGSLLGKGNNVTIKNCEVQGDLSINNIESKITYGGIVGAIENVSAIENCCSYVNVKSEFDLLNTYTINYGGIVGEIANSTIKFGVANCDFDFANESSSVNVVLYQGGIVGNIYGSTSQISNCSVANSVLTQGHYDSELEKNVGSLQIDDEAYIGGLIGSITNPKPEKGNINSSGYYLVLNETQKDKMYGNEGSVLYEFKDSRTKDYVIEIQEGYLQAQKFYENDDSGEPNEYGMLWNELLPAFDFNSTWIIADNRACLQQFQKFEIKINEQLLDQNNFLTGNNYDNLVFNYGEWASFEIRFVGETASGKSEYEGYYEIYDILKDGTSIGFSDFLELNNNDEVNGKKYSELKNEGTTIKIDENEKYMLRIDKDKTSQMSVFTFSVKAEYSTKGEYSFRTIEIPFTAYVVADDGGKIKRGSYEKQALEPQQLTKGKNLEFSAVAEYKHVFKAWNLYESISETDYILNADDVANYFKYEYTDSITRQQITTYWKLKEAEFSDLHKQNMSITFGESDFTKNFLIRATFDKSVYFLNINNFDVEKLKRIEVLSSQNETYTFDGNSKNTDFFELDQNETVSFKVIMNSGFIVSTDSFPKELKISMIDKGTVTEDGVEYKYYTFSISTSSFGSVINSQNQMIFEVNAEIDEEKDTNSSSIWLIIGIAGGGVLLLAIVIIIIVKSRRGKVSKKQSKSDIDYRQMYM